jgi:hypothetical protein
LSHHLADFEHAGVYISEYDLHNPTGLPGDDVDYIKGLSYASFQLTSLTRLGAVPEPSTWVMMLVGFAGLGVWAYRRNSKPTLIAA